MSIKIGDFVTGCYAGYWQLVDIKPKIATEDYSSGNVRWKKGDKIGQWVILKKAFTLKMKPKIEFSCEDSSWLWPVAPEVLEQIQNYFLEHPDYKEQFDNAQVELAPCIVNCWMKLSEKEEADFRRIMGKVSVRFTMDEFWKKAKKYQKNITPQPATHLLNILTHPWEVDRKANLLCVGCELIRLQTKEENKENAK